MKRKDLTPEKAEAQRRKAREWSRGYRKKNRDRILAVRRAHYANNRDRKRAQARAEYWQNPERTRALARARYRRAPKRPSTPEQMAMAREATRRHRARHRERLKERERQRIANEPAYKFARLLRSRVGKAVKAQYAEKAVKTMDAVGCSMYQLLAHLEAQFEPGMSWSNYGRYGWHIDHIRPCASFDLSKPDQQKLCFHYTNLKPTWARRNESKSSKIEGELPLLYRHPSAKQR